MVRPIAFEDRDILVNLLCEGFSRPRDFWIAGLRNIEHLGGNAETGVPLGYVISDKDTPVGVVLTPASFRSVPSGGRGLVVNISSWYIAPEFRWRGAAMLRSILRTHDAMFTDLTPTPEVRKINAVMGFEPINQGVMLTMLPAASAGGSGGAAVRELDERSAVGLPAATAEMLLRHKAIGCLPVLIETNAGRLVAMFRLGRIKGMPAARMVYCDSNAALADHLPVVARFLMTRGMLAMISDDTGQRARFGQVRRPFGLKFAKPGAGLTIDRDRIDQAWSELCCFAL